MTRRSHVTALAAVFVLTSLSQGRDELDPPRGTELTTSGPF